MTSQAGRAIPAAAPVETETDVSRWKDLSPALIKKQRLDWGYQFYKTQPNRLYKPHIVLMTDLLVELPPSLNLCSQTKSKTETSILTTQDYNATRETGR
jgi:hypothetical protein